MQLPSASPAGTGTKAKRTTKTTAATSAAASLPPRTLNPTCLILTATQRAATGTVWPVGKSRASVLARGVLAPGTTGGLRHDERCTPTTAAADAPQPVTWVPTRTARVTIHCRRFREPQPRPPPAPRAASGGEAPAPAHRVEQDSEPRPPPGPPARAVASRDSCRHRILQCCAGVPIEAVVLESCSRVPVGDSNACCVAQCVLLLSESLAC